MEPEIYPTMLHNPNAHSVVVRDRAELILWVEKGWGDPFGVSEVEDEPTKRKPGRPKKVAE